MNSLIINKLNQLSNNHTRSQSTNNIKKSNNTKLSESKQCCSRENSYVELLKNKQLDKYNDSIIITNSNFNRYQSNINKSLKLRLQEKSKYLQNDSNSASYSTTFQSIAKKEAQESITKTEFVYNIDFEKISEETIYRNSKCRNKSQSFLNSSNYSVIIPNENQHKKHFNINNTHDSVINEGKKQFAHINSISLNIMTENKDGLCNKSRITKCHCGYSCDKGIKYYKENYSKHITSKIFIPKLPEINLPNYEMNNIIIVSKADKIKAKSISKNTFLKNVVQRPNLYNISPIKKMLNGVK